MELINILNQKQCCVYVLPAGSVLNICENIVYAVRVLHVVVRNTAQNLTVFFIILKASCIFHCVKHVFTVRDKSLDWLSLPFSILNLLPTLVHQSVTDCHVLQHTCILHRESSQFGRLLQGCKVNIRAVF